MIAHEADTADTFETLIPTRLDRLFWSQFHWLLVIGLGITWVLDGLEITLMGAISAVLQRPDVLHFSAAQIGFISSSTSDVRSHVGLAISPAILHCSRGTRTFSVEGFVEAVLRGCLNQRADRDAWAVHVSTSR